jgi:hypothetical protein
MYQYLIRSADIRRLTTGIRSEKWSLGDFVVVPDQEGNKLQRQKILIFI